LRFRETAIVSGGLLAQQASVFATGILTARLLGSDGYGVLGILKSLATVLVIITPLGLDLALLKHASFYRDRPAELQETARALRLVVAVCNVLLLALVAACVGPWLAGIYDNIPRFATLCVITMLGLLFAADVQVSSALYRVSGRVVRFSLVVNYCQPALRFLLSAAVLVMGGGVESVTWVSTVMFVYAFVMLAWADRGTRVAPIGLPVRLLARKIAAILSESLWMALSLLVYQSIRLADVLILAALAGPSIAGEYAAMSSVAQLIQIYPNAISQTLGPRIAQAYRSGDREDLVAALKDYLRKAAILGGYLFGGIAIFGQDLSFVFGPNFHFAWQLPILLATGWYLSATLAPFGYVLSMTGRHKQELAILTCGALLLIVALLALVPALKAVGTALAVAIVFAVVNAARCSYVIRIIGRNPLGLEDLVAPLCFLAVAWACRMAGGLAMSPSLGGLIIECVAYSVLAAAVVLTVIGSAEERRMVVSRFRLGRALP